MRSRGTAARRWTRRATPSSTSSTRARDAAAAAADAQRALQAHAWPEDAELRVRMGMHTGEPVVSEERYHGLGVHRAARIMAAGHGGQILASQATAAMLADDELARCGAAGTRRVPAQGPRSSRAPLPARRRGAADDVSAAPDRRCADCVRRQGRRARRSRGWCPSAVLPPTARHRCPRGCAGGGGRDSGLRARHEARGARSRSSASRTTPWGWSTPHSRTIVDEAPEIASPQRVAAGEGSIWVTSSSGGGSVVRLDPESHDVTDTIEVGNGPVGIAVGAGAVWVANSLDGTVSRIDPATGEVVDTIPVGNTPTGVAFGAGAVWVTNADDRSVSKIDPVDRRGRAADRRRRGRALDRGRRRRRLGDRSGRQRARAHRRALGHGHRPDPRRERPHRRRLRQRRRLGDEQPRRDGVARRCPPGDRRPTRSRSERRRTASQSPRTASG